jgi:hypothetical protein
MSMLCMRFNYKYVCVRIMMGGRGKEGTPRGWWHVGTAYMSCGHTRTCSPCHAPDTACPRVHWWMWVVSINDDGSDNDRVGRVEELLALQSAFAGPRKNFFYFRLSHWYNPICSGTSDVLIFIVQCNGLVHCTLGCWPGTTMVLLAAVHAQSARAT